MNRGAQRAATSSTISAILVRASFSDARILDRFVTLGLSYRVIVGPGSTKRAEDPLPLAYFRDHSPSDDLAFERMSTCRSAVSRAHCDAWQTMPVKSPAFRFPSLPRVVDNDELKPKATYPRDPISRFRPLARAKRS